MWERGLIEQRGWGYASKSWLGMDPWRGDCPWQPQMVDGTHRKRINCLISTQRGTGLLLADKLLRGVGMGMGIGKEKESRGSRQQMNLHLCSEASRDIRVRTSQPATEVQLWPHSSGFSPLKIHFSTFSIGVYYRTAIRHLCNDDQGQVASSHCSTNVD